MHIETAAGNYCTVHDVAWTARAIGAAFKQVHYAPDASVTVHVGADAAIVVVTFKGKSDPAAFRVKR